LADQCEKKIIRKGPADAVTKIFKRLSVYYFSCTLYCLLTFVRASLP